MIWALVGVGVVVGVAAVALLAGVWYYAELLKSAVLEPNRSGDVLDLRVSRLVDGRVTFEPAVGEESRDWKSAGVFGVEWPDGYGQVGEIRAMDGDLVERDYVPLAGSLQVGDVVRLDSFALPADPQAAHGIEFETVTFESELGELPAWFVPGSRDTWAIFVHGKGANRREALRMLPATVEAGLPSLVITYRNDEGVAESPDGFYRYGQTEWRDLRSAVDHATEAGARRIVLVGYSMGGAIVTKFMLESRPGELVPGLILDSPAMDLGAIVDKEARNRGIPGIVASVGKAATGLRFSIDWRVLNYLSRVDELEVPILLFHGGLDTTVFVETSDAFAEARPDIVTYVRATDVDHVRSWNADREGYLARVRGFLERVVE